MQIYQIIFVTVIGEGAHGVVLKCPDVGNDMNVAIKN